MTPLTDLTIGTTIKLDTDEPARLHRLDETHWRVHLLDKDGNWATTANIERTDNDEFPWWIYPPFAADADLSEERTGERDALRIALDFPVPTDADYED